MKDVYLKKKSNFLSYLEGWLSIVVNVILFILKYWAGTVTGSIAIIADAWHTLSDSVSSIIVLIGIKVSAKPADKEHPFGHGRAELIASIIIGVLLSIIAYNFVKESISKLNNHGSANFGSLAIIVTVISILCKEALAQFAFWAAKKTDSNILKADGWHHRSDAISSIIILAGIFLGKYFWWIDGVLGIVVALLIFLATFEIFKDSINHLLGKKPDKKLLTSITLICQEIAGKEITAHHFHLHDYRNHAELTFHIKLPENMSILKAHNIASKIEDQILNNLNIEATIHMEPHQNQGK